MDAAEQRKRSGAWLCVCQSPTGQSSRHYYKSGAAYFSSLHCSHHSLLQTTAAASAQTREGGDAPIMSTCHIDMRSDPKSTVGNDQGG